ncbi:integral membrane protein [Calycina marina]|uniref:Integral membrane protein n=1 Tax=Calycina marina TaxID=1763456 RepID=A0A9P8CES6_9HELO|nr:integral membrane protein [Calycina marina]
MGAVAEPLVVVTLLLDGTYINQDSNPELRRRLRESRDMSWNTDTEESRKSLLGNIKASRDTIYTPNYKRFKEYFLSRLLQKFPPLVECWYWGAAIAVWIVEGAIHSARQHALQVITAVNQQFLMKHQFLMTWINRTYSFIHTPGPIAFTVSLFYYTNTRNGTGNGAVPTQSELLAESKLFKARRRTMDSCNLIAFIIFAIYPCMPPRLLSKDTSVDASGELARSYGFVDTVHGPLGEGSIWTDNRFTNKFAAMPSLPFGYSLRYLLQALPQPRLQGSSRRNSSLSSAVVGVLYPTLIPVAIVAAANHFILDPVPRSLVSGLAWRGNYPTQPVGDRGLALGSRKGSSTGCIRCR